MPNLSDRLHDDLIRDTIRALRYEAGLSRRVLSHLRGLEKDLLAALADAGDLTSQRKLNALLVEARAAIADRFGGATGVFDDEIKQFGTIQAGAAVSGLNAAVGVDLFGGITADQAKAIASDALIEGAPSSEWWALQESDTLRKFKNIVRAGMVEGQTGDQMARMVRDMMQTSMRNAQALVRTSVISVNANAHMAAYEANDDIIEGVTWVSTLDSRSCLRCGQLDGKTWNLREGHPVPALHWNCFVPGTKVQAPNILRGFERAYTGDVVIIRTAGGNEVTCTPNHPVLTPNGWVAAGELKEGDEVVKSLGGDWALGSAPDGVEVETCIEDVVGSLLRSRGMVPVTVPLTSEDFHGDAVNHQVATVWANGKLRGSDDSEPLEHVEELSLIDGTPGGNVGLACPRCQRLLIDSFHPTPSSLMRVFREAESLVWGSLSHAEGHSITAPSLGDTQLIKAQNDGVPGNPKMDSKSLHARAGIVASDYLEIVEGDSRREINTISLQQGVCKLGTDPVSIANLEDSLPTRVFRDDGLGINGLPLPDASALNSILEENGSDCFGGSSIGCRDFGYSLPARVAITNSSSVNQGVPGAHDNTASPQYPVDSVVIGVEVSSDFPSGCAIGVCLDDVISLRKERFVGHVYNLETEGNWYVANGIITHNCRCALIPKTKSWEQLAREAHGNSTMAKRLDEMSGGTRASMDGQVPGSLNYEEWLKSKPAEVQQEILGPARFRLMQKGKLSLSDLTDMTGHELTLKELAAL